MSVNSTFGDREMATDLLHSQKAITGDYNNYANECAGNEVKNLFMSILNEEHTIQHDVFSSISKRGWYSVESAPQDKVNQIKQQFSQG